MNTIAFYICSLVLCRYAYVMIKESSPYAMSDGKSAEKLSTRRILGRLLIATAAVSAVMGVLDQFAPMHR
jgi:hypothetical protein